MNKIWKATLSALDKQLVKMPADAEILHAREQMGAICVWYRCEPTRPPVDRKILIVGTGHTVLDGADAKYLGTASLDGGRFIFHVFEDLT